MQFIDWQNRYPRVDGDNPGFVGEHRIKIDFANFRKIGDELRQLDQKKLDGTFVGGRHVAVGLENPRHPGARDEPARKLEIERRQRQRLVADDLDRHSPLPERDHRTEGRIVGHADDELARLGAHDHRKNGNAIDARVGLGRSRAVENVRCRRAHGGFIAEVEPHAADLRFVNDVGRLDLQHNRRAFGEMRPRRRHDLIGIARQRGRRNRNVVSRKQP